MYHDFNIASRDGWKYPYKGAELIEAAKNKHDEFLALEIAARTTISELVLDTTVSRDDQRLKDADAKLHKNGANRESCAVFLNEFKRDPKREYNLSLGDVVFFGLVH